jgi:Flp pilus assembly protein TadG
MSIELVLIMPMLLGVLALVFAFARVSIVTSNFDAGVRDAARAATQERNVYAAQQAAEATLENAASRASQGCAETLHVESIATFQPGRPVEIVATCEYPMVDVMGFLPGTFTMKSTFTSPLDPNRGIEGATP